MTTKKDCILLFPANYIPGIRNLLAVAASTDEARHGSYFGPGPDRLEAEAEFEAARRAAMSPGELDRRPVGVDEHGDVVHVYELWRDAMSQLAYEAGTNRQDWAIVARRAALADDARQCADDLGIKGGWMPDEECLAELERVGLGGLIDAAAVNPKKTFRGLGPS